jgi:hypothetical protein
LARKETKWRSRNSGLSWELAPPMWTYTAEAEEPSSCGIRIPDIWLRRRRGNAQLLENLARQGVSTLCSPRRGRLVWPQDHGGQFRRRYRFVRVCCGGRGFVQLYRDSRRARRYALGMSDMRIIEGLAGAYLEENAALLQAADAIVCDAACRLPFWRNCSQLPEAPRPC